MTAAEDMVFCLVLALWVWAGLRLIEADWTMRRTEQQEGEGTNDTAIRK